MCIRDRNYAWPTAEIAVMGGAGAVEVLYAREAKDQENPCLLYTSNRRKIKAADKKLPYFFHLG